MLVVVVVAARAVFVLGTAGLADGKVGKRYRRFESATVRAAGGVLVAVAGTLGIGVPGAGMPGVMTPVFVRAAASRSIWRARSARAAAAEAAGVLVWAGAVSASNPHIGRRIRNA